MRSDHGTKLKGESIEFYDQCGISYDFSALRAP